MDPLQQVDREEQEQEFQPLLVQVSYLAVVIIIIQVVEVEQVKQVLPQVVYQEEKVVAPMVEQVEIPHLRLKEQVEQEQQIVVAAEAVQMVPLIQSQVVKAAQV